MKFIRLVGYVEESYRNNPSFLILMSDGKEYISNGCTFVENTTKNIDRLEAEHPTCTHHVNKLLLSSAIDIGKVVNTSCMFWGYMGIEGITEFDEDLSSVVIANDMFYNCQKLSKFTSDLPSLLYGNCIFERCRALTEFTGNINEDAEVMCMFRGCPYQP
jgi:hypothetical protein